MGDEKPTFSSFEKGIGFGAGGCLGFLAMAVALVVGGFFYLRNDLRNSTDRDRAERAAADQAQAQHEEAEAKLAIDVNNRMCGAAVKRAMDKGYLKSATADTDSHAQFGDADICFANDRTFRIAYKTTCFIAEDQSCVHLVSVNRTTDDHFLLKGTDKNAPR